MAIRAVRQCGVSIALACRTFQISESCYRYERKLGDENAEIADWLVRLTTTYRILGVRPLLSLSAQCQRLCMEPQTRSADLPGTGVEPAHQAQEAVGSGKAGTVGCPE